MTHCQTGFVALEGDTHRLSAPGIDLQRRFEVKLDLFLAALQSCQQGVWGPVVNAYLVKLHSF
jgi:hypothetical protein